MKTANLTLIQSCYDICFSQFYIPRQYEECSVHIILNVIAVLLFSAFYRLNVNYIASYHSNGTSNTSQTLSMEANICYWLKQFCSVAENIEIVGIFEY